MRKKTKKEMSEFIYCKQLKEEIVKAACDIDETSSTCKACPEKPPEPTTFPKSQPDDSKNRFRKKPYTQLFKTNFKEDYQNFIEEYKKVSKKSLSHVCQFINDKFGNPGSLEEKNKDFKIVYFCNDEKLKEKFLDLGDRGANIGLINDALQTSNIPEYLMDDHPSALKLYKGELHPKWNERIEKYNDKKKKLTSKRGSLKGAIRQIEKLDPIPETVRRFADELPLVNKKLREMQYAVKEFEEIFDLYFDAKAISDGIITYSEKWGLPITKLMEKKYRPISQKSHNIWSDKIIALVNEIERIGYSFEQAYTITANLLHLAYPHLYKDKDSSLVKQQYIYHKKQKK